MSFRIRPRPKQPQQSKISHNLDKQAVKAYNHLDVRLFYLPLIPCNTSPQPHYPNNLAAVFSPRQVECRRKDKTILKRRLHLGMKPPPLCAEEGWVLRLCPVFRSTFCSANRSNAVSGRLRALQAGTKCCRISWFRACR